MDLRGELIRVFDTKQVSEKFALREFVIETKEQYPQSIILQVSQDKCKILDNYKLGDLVQVSINVRGRKWTDKEGKDRFFNTLEVWKITNESSTPVSVPVPAPEPTMEDDKLPF
jgi:hypothetical protein